MNSTRPAWLAARVECVTINDIPARKTHRAAGGLVQRGKDVQQSGFSAAALAHDGDVFALLYGEIYVPQGLYLYCAEARGIYLL